MKVSLFITCLVDQLFPEVGISTVRLLRRLGCEVDFPPSQICCGQPAFNAGLPGEARRLARRFLRTFAEAEVVVAPSGSCAGMVGHGYRQLLEEDRELATAAERLASRTHELSRFLVSVLGVEDVGARFPHRVTWHPSCHASRIMGVREEPLRLLRRVRGLELVELPRSEDCCGFGGLFAAKMDNVSAAMTAEKVSQVESTAARYLVGGDMGCLMNIGGYLRRHRRPVGVLHLAQVLDAGHEPD